MCKQKLSGLMSPVSFCFIDYRSINEWIVINWYHRNEELNIIS